MRKVYKVKLPKGLVAANIGALCVNGVVVWMTIILTWPPVASFAVFTALLAGGGFLSYYAGHHHRLSRL